MANPIRYSDIFDFTSDKGIQTAIKKIKNLDKMYTQMVGNAKKLAPEYAKAQQQVAKAILSVANASNKLNPAIQKDQQQLAAASKSMDILTASSDGLTKKTATLGTSIKNLEAEQKKFNAKAKEAIRLEKEEARLKAKLASANSKEAKEVANLRAQMNQKNKELKRSAQESLKLVSIYDREVNKLNILTREYKELAIQYGVNSKQARRLKSEMDKLRTSITAVNRSTGNFSDNVGNYPKRFAAAAAGARQLAAALGFTGVIFALVGAFRSAFNIIRNFDKEMTNMAAIAGKSRDQMVGLEMEIRRVAKTSINAANEVASTATALFTLGKTEDEIIDLLEPVNQLAIALQAPADEAGELLVQNLNAFGKSSESAQEYADIIAKMRTSTALDFERIKDSLGFLSPVARAVGLDFAETGSILGILVDNGIKAARAGRLMSTAFLRLSKQGRTLEGVLDDVNKMQESGADRLEIMSFAAKRFGAEAAPLGLILANNRDRARELTGELRDSQGVLQELTDKQLVSMDAKVRILGSAWEELWITMGEGDGILDNFAREFIDTLTEAVVAVTNLDLILKTALSSLDELSDKEIVKLIDIGLETNSGKRVSDFYKIVENTPFPEVIKEVDKYRDQVVGALVAEGEALDESTRFFNAWYNEKLKGYKTAQTAQQLFDKAQEKGLKTFKDFEDAGIKFFYRDQAHQLEILTLVQEKYNDKLKDSKDAASGLTETQRDGVKAATDLAKANNKLADSEEFVFEASEDIMLGAVSVTKTMKQLELGVGSAADTVNEFGKEVEESMEIPVDEAERSFTKLEKFVLRLHEKFKNLGTIIHTAFESASIAVNQFFTNQSIKSDNAFNKFEEKQQSEIDALEERRERELENENLTAEAKKAINQRYADSIGQIENTIEERRKQAQKQQAKAAKQQAIFNIILSTAQGIVAALTSIPPNVPLSIAIGVIGGVQLAAAASQPLPAFAKGTDNAPGGLAVVGEKGRELVMEPSGKTYLTGSGPELRDIPQGSQILTNVITERILRQNAIVNEGENYNQSANKIQGVARQEKFDGFRQALKLTMEKENDYMVSKFISGLQSLPLNNWSFTDKGQVTRSVQKGNTIRKDVELENKY